MVTEMLLPPTRISSGSSTASESSHFSPCPPCTILSIGTRTIDGVITVPFWSES